MARTLAIHRRPPKPPWFHLPRRGVCRWCNKPIVNEAGKPARTFWHKACVDNYNCVFWFTRAANLIRRAAETEGGFRCAACNLVVDVVEVDHIIPLAEALPHVDDPWWQWRPANLQALCPSCHAAKTAAQAARWARWREGRKKSTPRQAMLFREAS